MGCLITLREGLRDAVARDPIVDARFLHGLDDQLGLLADALETRSGGAFEEIFTSARTRVQHPHTSRLLRDVALARQRLTTVPRALAGWLWLFEDLGDRMDSLDLLLREIEDTVTTGTEAAVSEAMSWLTECARSLRERRGDLTAVAAHWTDAAADEGVRVVLPSWEQLTLASATAPGRDLLESASRLDATIAGLISEMNFEFLYNPERRLFRSASTSAICGSTRRTTTCWPPKRGWRVSWRLRSDRSRTSTGSRWAVRRRRQATAGRCCPGAHPPSSTSCRCSSCARIRAR